MKGARARTEGQTHWDLCPARGSEGQQHHKTVFSAGHKLHTKKHPMRNSVFVRDSISGGD
eukprot:764024-Hanusia_phi.AAC.3